MSSAVKDFTKGNTMKQLVLFSAPLFFSNLLQVVYNMVDMLIVGDVMGNEGISAVNVGGDLSHLLTFIAIGFSNAGQVIIAQYIGRGDKEKIGKFIGTMSSFLFFSAITVSSVSIYFQDSLLRFMKTPDEAYYSASEYSFICMLGLVFIYGYNMVSAVLRGMGDSKHPFIFISIAAALNVILDCLFVYNGKGAGGAALATVISQGASFISCAVFLYIKRESFSINCSIKDFLIPDRKMLSELIKLGVPMAIKMAAIQFSKLFVNSRINAFGLEYSAFAGIANKIASISNLISAAMNTAGSTMVGQNIAAGKEKRVKDVLKSLSVITLSVSTLLTAVFFFFGDSIISFFAAGDKDIMRVGENFFGIALLLFYASALRAIMNALLNGSGNYKVNFATAIFDGIIMRIGLAVLFGTVLGMGYYGYLLGDAVAGFTPFVIGIVFYVTGIWKRNMPQYKKEKHLLS